MTSIQDPTLESTKVDPTRWPILFYKRVLHLQQLPYGYKFPEGGDRKSLVPDPVMVSIIEEALQALDEGKTLRDVSLWLSEATGQSISHVTLSKIWKKLNGKTSEKIKQNIETYSKKKRVRNRPEKKKYNTFVKLRNEKIKLAHLQKRIDRLNNLHKERAELAELVQQDEVSKEVETKKGVSVARPSEEFPSNVLVKHETPVVPSPNVELTEFDTTVAEQIDDRKIGFKPNPGPQTEFLSASESEVGYGGSAGGGKSYSLLADPMRYFLNPNFRGLLVRRTNDELKELKQQSKVLYPKIFGKKASWSEKNSEWTFEGGGRFWFTYLERDDDVMRYQGQQFSWIGFDELTQYPTPYAWNYLRSRLRTVDPELPTFMRATFNPGGPGHNWVKSMFIDPAPKGKAFWATNVETGKVLVQPDTYPMGHPRQGQPNPDAGKPLFKRRFIPSSVFDNPYLVNTGYVEGLMGLPEMQRRQLLEGDWSVAEGAAFPEFRETYHVVEPFPIPHSWTRFRSCDYGYSSASAVHWYAIDPAYGTLVVYRELYVSKQTGEELADTILEIERLNKEKMSYGVLDSSVWHNRGFVGPPIAEVMNAKGCRWRPSDRSPGARVAGKNRLHQLLRREEIGDAKVPGIVFFDTCRKIISTLPVIPMDKNNPEDIDKKYQDDHAYDSIRYGIMSRPRSNSVFDWAGTNIEAYKNQDTAFDPTFGY